MCRIDILLLPNNWVRARSPYILVLLETIKSENWIYFWRKLMRKMRMKTSRWKTSKCKFNCWWVGVKLYFNRLSCYFSLGIKLEQKDRMEKKIVLFQKKKTARILGNIFNVPTAPHSISNGLWKKYYWKTINLGQCQRLIEKVVVVRNKTPFSWPQFISEQFCCAG